MSIFGRIRSGTRMCVIAAMVLMLIAGAMQPAYAKTTVVRLARRAFVHNGHTYHLSDFTVNGKPAFCIEKGKLSPATGTVVTAKEYKATDLNKYLYYGYGGLEQWDGFKSTNEAKVCTEAMLSFAHYNVKDLSWISGYSGFSKYLSGKSKPSLELKLSNYSLKGSYGEDGGQKTDTVTVSGSSQGELKLDVPDNVVLHDVASNSDKSGIVALHNGDSFYLKTNDKTDIMSALTISGSNRKLTVTRFVTASSKVQDLVQLNVLDGSPMKLQVEWAKPPRLKLIKQDSEGKPLGGATFKLVECADGKLADGSEVNAANIRKEGNEGELLHVDSDGIYESDELLEFGHSYAVCEIESPDGYMLSDEVKTFTVSGDNTDVELTISNAKQHVAIIIHKQGISYQIRDGRVEKQQGPLADVGFEICKGSEVIKKLTTDSNGRAEASGLEPGKYTVREVSAPRGYEMETDAKTIDAKVDKNQESAEYNADFIDTQLETGVTIVKCDKKTRRKLADAVFTISDSSGNQIEVHTDSTGSAVVSNLPEGHYTVREIEAPSGYTINDASQEFDINYDTEADRNITLVFYDSKKETGVVEGNDDIPSTGDHGMSYFYMGCIGLCTAGFILLTVLRRCDKF